MILDDLKHAFSTEYFIRPVTEVNIEDALAIMQKNTYYYSRTQFHPVTIEECVEDIYTTPPNIDISKKHYIALYNQEKCVVLIDYVEGYPSENVLYLGLLMIHPDDHGKGLGEKVVNAVMHNLAKNGFDEIKLACYETNEIGYKFWCKMGFVVEKESERVVDGITLKLLEMHRRVF